MLLFKHQQHKQRDSKMTDLKSEMIAMGGKEWNKNGMERVYINNDILNKIEDKMGMTNSRFGERNNKIFFDVKTSAIMRSYKGKKPEIQIQL